MIKEFERHKIFQSGNYPQGDYPAEKVKKIFGNAKEKTEGIFVHSSKWDKADKEPIKMADFGEIEIIESGDDVEIYANIAWTELGKMNREAGMFSGVSVELPDDVLTKIAILPFGTQPAIAGAEFETKKIFYTEFEEMNIDNNEKGGNQMTLEEILAATGMLTNEEKGKIVKEIIKTADLQMKSEIVSDIVEYATTEEKMAINKLQRVISEWEVMDDKQKKEIYEKGKAEFSEKAKPKTEVQIRAEITAEFEEKEKTAAQMREFEDLIKAKVIPAYQQPFKLLVGTAIKEKSVVEFEEADGKKISMTVLEKVKKDFQALPEFQGTLELTKGKADMSKNKDIDFYKKQFEDMKKI